MANALAVPLAVARPGSRREAGFASCGGRTSRSSRRSCVYLPFSKHLHIATSFFNIYFRKLAPRGELPAMDLEDETATFGLRTLAGPRLEGPARRLHLHRVRPLPGRLPGLDATGKPLNPKTFIMGIRDMSVEAEHGDRPHPELADRPRDLRPRRHRSPTPAALAAPIVDNAIPYDAVWDCVTCGACVEACPVLIEHVDKIVGAAPEPRPRGLALPAGADRPRSRTWSGPATRGASRRRPGPTGRRACRSTVPTVAELAADGPARPRSRSSTGSAARPRSTSATSKVARAFATCLEAAGVRFAILGQEESCTGDPARRMGNEYVFQMLATGNVETLDRYGLRERSSRPARTASTRSATSTASSAATTRSSTTRPTCQRLLADGRLRTIDADASRRHRAAAR